MSELKSYTSKQVTSKFDANVSKIEGGKQGIHDALIMAAQHIVEHGNWKIMNTLVKRLEESEKNLTSEAKAIVEWSVSYLGMSIDEETKEFSGFQGAQFIRDKFQEARKNPFWKKQKVEQPFEFDDIEAIYRLVESIKKAEKKAANENSKVTIHEGIQADLLAIAKKYAA